MQSVSKLPKLDGKRVLVRVDYNVPLRGNTILDTRRIESSFATIDVILKKGGVPVLLAHLGDAKATLAPIARFLSKRYKKTVFVRKPLDSQETALAVQHAPTGSLIVLENIRRDVREEKNDRVFSRILSALGNYYVNDAFSVSHRMHASVIGIPKYLKSFAGVQLEAEIKALSSVIDTKTHPFLFILGGAKFGTKIPLLRRFVPLADGVVITGALLNNFYKAAGFEVGASVVEAGFDTHIRKLLKHPKLLLPTDVVVVRGGKKVTVAASEVEKGDKIGDIGPSSIALISERIKKAKLVVWNGPTGWYEGGFSKGTVALAAALIDARVKGIIGGGDTTAVIEKMLAKIPAKQNQIFVSTGGGATLEFLSKGTLPGIKALK